MKKKPSNLIMKPTIDYLDKIVQVQPSDKLYQDILARIEQNKNTISLKWVSVASVAIVLLILTNITIYTQCTANTHMDDINIMTISDNKLYDE